MNPLLIKRPFTVVSNETLADGCFRLVLEPAEQASMFPFIAGQWVYLYLLNEDGSEWARAAFSIASAPSGSRERFELAIKVYGDFTTRARGLQPGSRVLVQGPFGVFTLRASAHPLVLFGGGIGVTPLLSMLREVAATGAERDVVLFYSNRSRADVAYEQELRSIVEAHPRIRIHFILTRHAPAGWDGESRRLDADMVRAHVLDLAAAEYLMCGPNPFMDGVQQILVSLGVDVQKKLRKERFS